MSIEGDASNSRAPAERNVYSKSMSTPNPKAPAGRYVYQNALHPYGRASCLTHEPQRGDMCIEISYLAL